MEAKTKILVIGVGNGGRRTVRSMVAENEIAGVDIATYDNNKQLTQRHDVDIGLQFVMEQIGDNDGSKLNGTANTKTITEVRDLLKDYGMVIITTGVESCSDANIGAMLSRLAKEVGALTIGLVAMPVSLEDSNAYGEKACWKVFEKNVDTLIAIPHNRLVSMDKKIGATNERERSSEDILALLIRGITDLLTLPGYISLGLEEISTVIDKKGLAAAGLGYGRGGNRAATAVSMAFSCPLLQDISVLKASGLLVNITANQGSLCMSEITEITSRVCSEIDDSTNIILGVVFDDNMSQEELRVTMIATGIKG